MLKRHYHIHVACTADMAASIFDSLALFFEQKAFLTYDLITNQAQTASYSRRCIDECDYMLLLIADSYGERNNTGVSQLHLSYVYAKTKNKPMLALIKTHDEHQSDLPRQLKDFIEVVENNVENTHYYDDSTNLDDLLSYACERLQQDTPPGWQQTAKDSNRNISSIGQNSKNVMNDFTGVVRPSALRSATHQGLTKQNQLEVNSLFNTSFETVLGAPNIGAANITAPNKSKVTSSDSAASASDAILVDNFGFSGHDSTQTTDEINAPVNTANTQAQQIQHALDNEVALRYSAHAYEEGNLSEVSMVAKVLWRTIVVALAQLPMPFNSHGIGRCVNGIISEYAEHNIKKHMPQVHAVSRCQIVGADNRLVQTTLLDQGWIEPVGVNQRKGRELWQVPAAVKNLL